MDKITQAGIELTETESPHETLETLMHICFINTESDLCAYYAFITEEGKTILKLDSYKGYKPEITILHAEEKSIIFLLESRESVCLLSKKESPFSGILLESSMTGGFAVPLIQNKRCTGVFYFNYRQPYRFTFQYITFVENLIKIALPKLQGRWRFHA